MKNDVKCQNVLVDMHNVANCVVQKESTVGELKKQQNLDNKESNLFLQAHASNAFKLNYITQDFQSQIRLTFRCCTLCRILNPFCLGPEFLH